MSEKTGLAVRENKEAVERYEQEAELSIVETAHKIDAVRAFIKAKLKSGYDYAKIPGTPRPTLLQPGAEKVCMYLRVRPEYQTKSTQLEEGHLEVEATCQLYSLKTANVVGAGVGSCSTLESRHRYRYIKAKEKPTQEEADFLKSKNLGKWMGSRDKGWAWYERVDNPNPHDQRHTVLLIACKRSLVKAVRTLAALSEVFSQDIEDFPDVEKVEQVDADELPQGRVIEGDAEPVENKPEKPADKILLSFTADKKKAILSGDSRTLAQYLGLKWNQTFGAKMMNDGKWEMAAAWVPSFVELAQKKGLPLEEVDGKPAPTAAEVGFKSEAKPEITDDDLGF